MSDKLRVRIWIDRVLTIDEDISVEDAHYVSGKHAPRTMAAAAAGKLWLVEISDPDLQDLVVARWGNDIERMENPLPTGSDPKAATDMIGQIASQRARKPWMN